LGPPVAGWRGPRLSRLSDERFEELLDAGRIHPAMKRNEASAETRAESKAADERRIRELVPSERSLQGQGGGSEKEDPPVAGPGPIRPNAMCGRRLMGGGVHVTRPRESQSEARRGRSNNPDRSCSFGREPPVVEARPQGGGSDRAPGLSLGWGIKPRSERSVAGRR
jgi:hypothetical protein